MKKVVENMGTAKNLLTSVAKILKKPNYIYFEIIMHNYLSSVLLSAFTARWFTLRTENSLTTHSAFLLTSHRLIRRICRFAQATQEVFQ